MIRNITAEVVYTAEGDNIPNGVLVVEDTTGEILDLAHSRDFNPIDLEIHENGVLIPGFVNTHCHLELSHMKGAVDTGTGLIPFITGVVTKRGNFSTEEIQAAIRKADREMWRKGIMAVGDISNQTDTFATKQASKIRYYTFVEMFDFFQTQNTEAEFNKWKTVYDALPTPNGSAKSMVPHAPYSVSKKLFSKINHANGDKKTISIHNQETPPENELFESGTGDFVEFYKKFGIELNDFKAPKKTAIHYALKNMDADQRTLFVHNTLTTKVDIEAAYAWGKDNVFWASCPNANLYIENRLPNYRLFLESEAQVTLGTDSLTSNWQLSILEEMKTIHRYQRYVPFLELLEWATINGARALGFEADLGSFVVGKKPGVLLLQGLDEQQKLTKHAKVKRLV